MKEGWVRDTPPQSRSVSGSVNTDLRRLRSGHHHHFTAPARGRERESMRRRGERESATRGREREEREAAQDRRGESSTARVFGLREFSTELRFRFVMRQKGRLHLFLQERGREPQVLSNGPQRSPFFYENFWTRNRAVTLFLVNLLMKTKKTSPALQLNFLHQRAVSKQRYKDAHSFHATSNIGFTPLVVTTETSHTTTSSNIEKGLK